MKITALFFLLFCIPATAMQSFTKLIKPTLSQIMKVRKNFCTQIKSDCSKCIELQKKLEIVERELLEQKYMEFKARHLLWFCVPAVFLGVATLPMGSVTPSDVK